MDKTAARIRFLEQENARIEELLELAKEFQTSYAYENRLREELAANKREIRRIEFSKKR